MAALVCLLVCAASGGAGMFGLSLYHRAADAQRHPDTRRLAPVREESAPPPSPR